MNKLCASCMTNPAVKQVQSAHKSIKVWRCQSCLDRTTASWISGNKQKDKEDKK